MQHSVYLQGELGERFGNKFSVHTENYRDIFKCIQANRPEFLPYIRKCHEEDIGFIIETEKNSIEIEDLLLPLQPGDITISLAPAGSKSGIGKILAAIAIVLVMVYAPGVFGTVGAAGGEATLAAGLSGWGSAAAMLATNLALTGIQQIMAPDPGVDSSQPTNYLFQGGTNNAVEGDPIPLLYGELTIPGRPISIEVNPMAGQGIGSFPGGYGYWTNNVIASWAGNINSVKIMEEE